MDFTSEFLTRDLDGAIANENVCAQTTASISEGAAEETEWSERAISRRRITVRISIFLVLYPGAQGAVADIAIGREVIAAAVASVVSAAFAFAPFYSVKQLGLFHLS